MEEVFPCLLEVVLSITLDLILQLWVMYWSLFIEFDKEVINWKNNMIVGVLYRPPGTDINDFVEEFSKMCSKIRTERKICYITGDYNINLLKSDSHLPTSTKCIHFPCSLP